MKLSAAAKCIPKWQNILLAVVSALLLILSFPDFDLYYLAWFGFVPLVFAIYRERGSLMRSMLLGWIFGSIFFVGTVWWLTYSPIHYAGFPPWLAYTLLIAVCIYVGLFPAMFSAISAAFFRRFDLRAFALLPFVWVLTEFLRYWLSGNSWNAIGYSQAFGSSLLPLASVGGVYLVGFAVLWTNSVLAFLVIGAEKLLSSEQTDQASSYLVTVFQVLGPLMFLIPAFRKRAVELNSKGAVSNRVHLLIIGLFLSGVFLGPIFAIGKGLIWNANAAASESNLSQNIIVVQVNVPMSGLTLAKWERLRERHVEMTEDALQKLRASGDGRPVTVVFPESPMNFMYKEDREFHRFINDFARRNNINVLFNSAEPDAETQTYFNSAMLVYGNGSEAGQYDKIYLVPFGEFVPGPLRAMVPGLIGSFASGREYDVFDINDTKAAIMLCYESNFGQLSRQLVTNGADYLIEMTNDGYLGETPVLRQHLTSAVFRAVETNRPVIRATNVGITAYVTPTGEVLDTAPVYAEATRVWTVGRSAGDRTLYVRFGDWIAWLSLFVVVGLSGFISYKRKIVSE